MELLTLWKSLGVLSRIASKCFHYLRRIPALDDFISRTQGSLLSPIVIRKIRKANDPDLASALELCSKRIPAGLRWEDADVIRWIKEDEKILADDFTSTRDLFIVAKHKGQVKGFVLLHLYPIKRTAFFAYMVISPNGQGLSPNQVSSELAAYVSHLLRRDKILRQCDRILFEVEDPRQSSGSKQLEQLARIKRLCSLAALQDCNLISFDVRYFQPRLYIPNDESPDDQSLILMSMGSTNCKPETDWARKEVISQLEFIYTTLYPEGFSIDAEEQQGYESYCNKLYKQALNTLPMKVACINPLHMMAVRKTRSKNKAPRDKLPETVESL